jgi:hypothetical protein
MHPFRSAIEARDLDDDGAITEFTVMVRPMQAMLALAKAMKVRFAAG